jgi:hypothetical protein
VPAGYFFEGAPGGWEAGDAWRKGRFAEFMNTRDGQVLIASSAKIRDGKLRRSLLDLVERLAVTGKSTRRAGPGRK